MASKNPLDLALANKGYFQIQTPEGVKLTRDGRFKYDKDGFLLDLGDNKVLSDAGIPIRLPIVPRDVNQIVVNNKGKVTVKDSDSSTVYEAGFLGIVDSNGLGVLNPEVKQGYNEHSNVQLLNEFMAVKPVRNTFDANRNMFRMQSSNLQKVISQLGSN